MKPIKGQMWFVRFGGLSPVKQDGYVAREEHDPLDPKYDLLCSQPFHAPPARHGVYAFVWPYIDTFMLGGRNFDSRRMEWVKDKNGNHISESHSDFKKHKDPWMEKDKAGEWCVVKHKKPKKFQHSGNLWHHLDVPHNEVLAAKHSWTLTNTRAFKKALLRVVGLEFKRCKQKGYGICTDMLEVFIERL